MTIEQTLERIAVALEKLAEQKAGGTTPTATGKAAVAQEVKPEPQRTRPGKKVEEPKEELIIEQEVQIDNTQEGFEDAPPIKFADLNKAWFNMLGEIKAAQGLPAAQGVAQELMDKYCGGKRFGEAAIDKSEYAAFMADINKETEAVSG